MNQFFVSGVQSVGASASTSVLPMNIQSLFPLGLTSARDAITVYHQEAVLSNRNVLSHSFGSQKSEMKMSAESVPSGGCDGKLCPRHHSLAYWMVFLCLFPLPVFSLCVCLCVQFSPFYKDTSPIGY